MGDKTPSYIKFLFGGLAGMGATCIVQPLDLIKTRMQVSGGTAGSVVQAIMANQGIIGFYDGLSAGLFRQATYTTGRLGVFNYLLESMSEGGKTPGFLVKAGIGITAGGTGAFIGVPAEVALIRMTADGRLPPAERRNYKHVFDALYRIFNEEGIGGLWRGGTVTVGRAMIANAAQLASYAEAKEVIADMFNMKDGIPLHFCSSMVAGFVTTVISLPVDIVKTRIQNMKIIDGKPEYKNITDVITKVIAKEGPTGLWKGIVPYFFKIGPHTVLTFIFLEQMNLTYKTWGK